MNITRKLCYGVNEDTPKKYLYPKRIILRAYNKSENNKHFMETMSLFNIFQYNHDKAIDSDYFMWQNVNDKGEKDWTHVELSCYQNDMTGVHRMYDLINICENIYTDINCEIQYNDIRNLIKKMESE